VRFDGYTTDGFYDELFLADGSPRPEARALVERIEALSDGELARRHQAAERALLRMGITFNVYGEEPSSERIFPFDIIPRIVSSADWAVIEHGLLQRIWALNHFIDDAVLRERSEAGSCPDVRSDCSSPLRLSPEGAVAGGPPVVVPRPTLVAVE
jgi:uncharacterized circularly permuted ATP-grasp superfamily protein